MSGSLQRSLFSCSAVEDSPHQKADKQTAVAEYGLIAAP